MRWTENRKNVAKFLITYFSEHGRSPSLDEIARGTGLWKRSVEIVLQGLVKMGIIEITPGISRGIRLLKPEHSRIPLIGDVQAGLPPLSQEAPVEYLSVDKTLLPFDDPIALRVTGHSMKDAGIIPGDIVLIRRQESANTGDTIIAYYNGGLTVKKYRFLKGRISLLPENPLYDRIFIREGDEFYIIGKVMVVLRDVGGCLDFKVVRQKEITF